MRKPKVQQRTERRISAALRLVMVAVLLLAQIALVIVLSDLLKQRMALAYTVLQLLAGVVAMRIWSRPGATSYKMGWIILVLFVPVVGLILYLLWNGDRPSKRLSLKKPVPIEEPLAQQELARTNLEKLRQTAPQWYPLAAYLSGKGFDLYRNTALRYLPTGEAYLEDMLTTLDTAQRFIFLEYFIMAEGEIWDRLSDTLCRKSRQGVEVKLIFDDFGSMMRMPNEKIDALQDAGVEVRVFNPVHHYVNRLYFNYRDHRKITCVDGDVAYTGGANIADEYANLIDRFGYWKDSGIRLEGEGVWGLTAAFLNMWSFLGGALHEERDYYRPHTSPATDGFCQPFLDGPQNNPDNPAEDTFLQLIGSARRFLYITTPYFIPDENIMRALCIAGDGGVDVRLMLPGTPDHWYADAVADSYIGELLEHHVKVYRYTPGFLHAKSIMVDREAAFVGSVNFDYRSFELHYECGVMLYGASAIESLLEDMDGILDKSHAVTPEEWAHRGLLRRMFEPILRIFSIWM